ncbi:MAG: aminotransferase class V-fold PLP-dependent enzyme [Chloroflexi bacterium]|nr:aminotransferase class V-fold PLP-dependent enzyme [Chloroflexota bacterium]
MDADPHVTLRNVGAALTTKTRLIAFSHVSCESGTRLPAKRICQLARVHGAWSLLDGAQSLGAIPVDVAELACDFFVSNGHKWLCGPKETGILYVRPDCLDALTLHAVGAGTFERFSWRGENFCYGLQPSARRFEFGTRNHAALVGLRAAISWLHDLGFPNVYEHIGELAQRTHQILAEIPGVAIVTPRSGEQSAGIVTFNVPSRNPAEIAQELRRQGVITRHTTTPPGVRASAAYFNTAQDFARLAAALHSLM